MKKRTISYIILFGALSIIMSSIRVAFPLGNPNLGSTPVSLSAIILNGKAVFMIGIIKGIGVSLWTGQALLELPAGLGDGIMGVFTRLLCKRMRAFYAIIIGQLSRYLFTSGIIALTLGTFLLLSPDMMMPLVGRVIPHNLQTNLLLSNIIIIWLAMVPAITASIITNALLSAIISLALEKYIRVNP